MSLPTALFDFLDGWYDDELPDGAWWAMLEEGVVAYNKETGQDIDPNDGVHAYLQARGDD